MTCYILYMLVAGGLPFNESIVALADSTMLNIFNLDIYFLNIVTY